MALRVFKTSIRTSLFLYEAKISMLVVVKFVFAKFKKDLALRQTHKASSSCFWVSLIFSNSSLQAPLCSKIFCRTFLFIAFCCALNRLMESWIFLLSKLSLPSKSFWNKKVEQSLTPTHDGHGTYSNLISFAFRFFTKIYWFNWFEDLLVRLLYSWLIFLGLFWMLCVFVSVTTCVKALDVNIRKSMGKSHWRNLHFIAGFLELQLNSILLIKF